MSTAFFQITSALIELLKRPPAVSPNIFRARDRHVPESYETAINVQFDASVPGAGVITGAPVDWTSKFTIDCYARSKTLEADEAVDPILSEVFARLAADETLGGLVGNVGSPYVEADYSAEGMRTGWVRLTYPIEHRTEHSTLE